MPPTTAPSPASLDGRSAEEVLRRLELQVTRRLDGILHGDYQGLVPGRGADPGEARRYEPGDDVRRIDWAVTARMQAPHTRDSVADRELETWVLVDRSPSLDFGTALCEKRDLALAAAAGVGVLTTRGGNRIGAVVVRGSQLDTLPPRQGRKHLMALLHRVETSPREDGVGPADLPGAIERLNGSARRRGLVVIISDLLGDPTTWARQLATLGLKHQLLVMRLVDPRDEELPDVGVMSFTDPSTGRTVEIDTTSARTRAAFAEAVAAHRTEVLAALRAAGADHVELRTDRDWVLDLARFVTEHRRRRTVAQTRRRPGGLR